MDDINIKRQKARERRKQEELDWQNQINERRKALALEQKVDIDLDKATEDRDRIKAEKERIDVEFQKAEKEWKRAYAEWQKVYPDEESN